MASIRIMTTMTASVLRPVRFGLSGGADGHTLISVKSNELSYNTLHHAPKIPKMAIFKFQRLDEIH